jgi:hypothetical protein
MYDFAERENMITEEIHKIEKNIGGGSLIYGSMCEMDFCGDRQSHLPVGTGSLAINTTYSNNSWTSTQQQTGFLRFAS